MDDGGRLGLGTSTPVVNAHIVSGNIPTLRLEQNGSYGFTPQTWDVAGNEANFFVRDATNSSRLPFQIKPSAPTNSLFIASSGRIGLGTQNPGSAVHLLTDSSTSAEVRVQRTGGAIAKFVADGSVVNMGAESNHALRFYVNNSWLMRLTTAGILNMRDGGSYNGTWNPASSREYKENIDSITSDEAMEALEGFSPVKYNYKVHKDESRVGFIAEDVPELVAMNGRKTLGTVDIVAVLTKVVQEQQAFIREQQKINAELKKKIAEMEKK